MTEPAYWPTITVEFGEWFGPGTLGDGGLGWDDLSPYVREIHTNRGRQTETQQFAAGTATILLDNQTGRFDPTGSTSDPYGIDADGLTGAFWGVGRQVRIRATFTGLGTLPVFYGYITNIAMRWDNTWEDVVEVSIVDAFQALQLATTSTTRGAEASGARISALIAASGIDLAPYVIDTGRSTMAAVTYSNQSVLQAIQDVELSENGQFYISSSGVAVFKQRGTTPSSSAYYTLTDNPTGTPIEVSYEAPVGTSYSDEYLFNHWVVTDAGSNVGTGDYADSQTAFGVRGNTRQSQINSSTEVQDAADYLAQTYGRPLLRLEQIVVNPCAQASTHTWDAILTPDLNERVDFVRNVPGGGTITKQMKLQAIQHDITNSDAPLWIATLGITPVLDSLGAAWILDDTTRLTY